MRSIRYTMWVITLLFFIIHLAIVLTHSTILLQQKLVPDFISVFYWSLLVLTGIILVVGIKKGNFKRTPSYIILCAAFSFLIVTGLVWMVTDSPVIENDYTKNAVIHQPNGSFHYLDIFNKADIQVLEKESKKISTANEKVFDEVWEEIKEFRNAIKALDQFNIICDLPKDTELDINVPFLKIKPLREVAKIHGRYFLFKMSVGESQDVIAQFCRLYRVARKGMENSTLLIHKMIFASIVEKSLETTWAALRTGNVDQKTLGTLQDNFTPIGFNEISLTRTIISEYLMMKNTMNSQITPENLMNSIQMVSGGDNVEESKKPLVSSIIYHFGFKPNQSLEDMKIYYDLLIEANSQYPVNIARADTYLDEYSKRPQVRNMIGWILNSMAMPNPGKVIDRMEKIKVKSDLLALFIHERLGKTLEINEFYTDQPLRYNKEGLLLKHPGKDGKYETVDDIILGEKDVSF